MRSAMRAASQLPGRGPLLWIWPLYLHVNKKSDDDDDDDEWDFIAFKMNFISIRNAFLTRTFHMTFHVHPVLLHVCSYDFKGVLMLYPSVHARVGVTYVWIFRFSFRILVHFSATVRLG